MIKIKQSRLGNAYVCCEFKYSELFVNSIKKLKYRKYDPDTRTWTIYFSEIDDLFNSVGAYNISFADINLEKRYMATKVTDIEKKDAKKEELKEDLKNVKPIKNYVFKTRPLPHQIAAFNRGVTSRSLLIGDDMGLGKTMESLNIACYRKQAGQSRKCLIICGVNATKYNWAEEIEKHTNEGYMIFDQSSPKRKLKKIIEWKGNDTYFGIINIESLRPVKLDKRAINNFVSGRLSVDRLQKNELVSELNTFVDMTIADEIHKMKNAKTKQGIALQQVNSFYKIGLSGTPLTNHVEDLWNILQWFGAEQSNYWMFRDKYCVMGGYNAKEVVGYKNLDELTNRLHSVMIRRTKEEVLDLPPKVYLTEYVELSAKSMKLYEAIRKGVIEELGNQQKIKEITLQNALTKMLRLRQVTEGINIFDDKIELMDDNPKLKRIEELLNEQIIPNGGKAIIFTCWKTTAELYRNALENYHPAFITGDVKSEQRQNEVNRFQNDEDCKIAIGTIGAMGTGYTMTAANYVFFVDKYWNETDNKQAEDRAHRIGAKGSTTIVSMVAKDTIDESIEVLLKEKNNLFDTIVNNKNTTSAEKEDIISILLHLEREWS